LTERCIESTKKAISGYAGEVEWLFIENGDDDENLTAFMNFDAERKVIVRQDNFGINQALNQGWALSRGEYVMIHENDWYNNKQQINFLEIGRQIFESNSMVDVIQLRDPADPNENWGFGKPMFNPWSINSQVCTAAGVKVWTESLSCGHEYPVSDFPNGFNNNPVLIRKSLYRQCGPMAEPKIGTDPRHDETHYQERVASLDRYTAHIGFPLYYHVGGAARQLFERTGRIV
jgi:glycosyltransferase involved in cell wall biosynthesis